MTSGLAFLPACGDGGSTTGDDESSSSPTTMTASATDESSAGDETPEDGSSTDDPTVTTLDTSSDGSSSDSGDPLCGGGTCGAVPPIGWFGPVIYARVEQGGNMPSCPADVLTAGPTVLDGFADPGAPVCGCECELSAPLTCTACMETNTIQNCQNYGGYYYGCPYGNTAVTDDCINVEIEGFISFISNDQGYYYGGGGAPTCDETAIEDIPLFAWDATIVTCRVPDSALACNGDGICVPPAPEGFENRWCMYQTGDLECPAGDYPNKTVFWSDVDDTRDCTNCQCGSAAASCQEQDLMVFDGPDCAGEPAYVLEPTGMCVAGTGGSIAGTGNEAACPLTEPAMPIGAIAPTGPFTFCCAD